MLGTSRRIELMPIPRHSIKPRDKSMTFRLSLISLAIFGSILSESAIAAPHENLAASSAAVFTSPLLAQTRNDDWRPHNEPSREKAKEQHQERHQEPARRDPRDLLENVIRRPLRKPPRNATVSGIRRLLGRHPRDPLENDIRNLHE